MLFQAEVEAEVVVVVFVVVVDEVAGVDLEEVVEVAVGVVEVEEVEGIKSSDWTDMTFFVMMNICFNMLRQQLLSCLLAS